MLKFTKAVRSLNVQALCLWKVFELTLNISNVIFQANAFRALRFLFSKERNRRLFKRMFVPDIFEVFIDVGHYNRDITAYFSLVTKINTLSVGFKNTSKCLE